MLKIFLEIMSFKVFYEISNLIKMDFNEFYGSKKKKKI